MKPKGFYNVFIIGLIFAFFIPIPVLAENLHNAEGLQILIAQQSAKGIWDMPNDMPSTGVKGGTPDIPSADKAAQEKMKTVQDKYKSELKKDCITLPNNLNINDNIPFSVMQIIDQYKNDPCEMMNEIKFHIDEKRGKNSGQIAWEMVKIFVIPDEGDVAEFLAKTFARHTTPVAIIYSKLSDAKQFAELIDTEINTNRLHGQYLEAINVYRSSKGWSMPQLKSQTDSLYADIKRKLSNIQKLERDLYSECMKYYPSDRELAVYGPPFRPGTKIPNDAMVWRRYYENIEPIEKRYNAEITTILRDIAGLELKIKFLENYRKPLIEKTCDQRIAEAKPNCPDADNKTSDPSKPAMSPSQKDREALYGCICWCTINPTVGVGASYNPKPIYGVLSSPSCEDPRYGPCVGAGLGCWRQHMNATGECFDRCVKNIGGDARQIKSEIDKMKLDAFNDFIKEARGIIEEYITKIVPSVYRKKASSHNGGSYSLFAQNIMNNMIDNQPLYAASAPPEAPMTYIEMIKEKNRRGDPDKALSLVNSALSILPDRRGEVQNILAEFAIMMSKASLNIVTELEFDEGLYLLRKAAEFYKVGESGPLGQNIKRLITAFEKWKKDWETLNREIPVCLSLINDKQVCGCDKLYKDRIYPAASSLTIYEFASSEKWGISTATGSPRPIPQKDKIFEEIKTKLSLAKSQCELNPVLSTKEMKDLIDYETRRSLERSPYINQEDLKKYSAPVICDTRAVKYADKILSTPDLCDCQQDKIKAILDMAKKYAEPLQADFTSDVKEVTVGQYVRLDFRVKGGKEPFTYEMSGDYPYNSKSEARGFTIQYQPKATGTITYYAIVVDSCGDSDSKKISVYVKPTAVTKAPETPKDKQPVNTKAFPPYQTPPSVQQPVKHPVQTPVYDPTKDAGIFSGKPIDATQIGQASEGFQQGQAWGKPKPDGQQQIGQQASTPQPDAYSGKPQQPASQQQPQDMSQQPYPPVQPPYGQPAYPPTGSRPGVTDWQNWAQQKPQSGQQPVMPPNGGTSPAAPVDTRTVGCNTTTKSGADAPATITVNVGRGAGTVKFYYEMYNVKDRMIVQYGGQTLHDTGCVSGSRTVPLNLSGASDSVVVTVQPQCEKKESTKWDFKIECPQPSAGQVATTTGSGSGKTSSAPTVIAELTNQSKDNTHIFVEGQENFGLQNKLAPGGGNRKVSVSVPVQGGRIKFIAGRNGQKLAECLWDYTPDSKSRVPVVTFYEPNRLSCVTGLR